MSDDLEQRLQQAFRGVTAAGAGQPGRRTRRVPDAPVRSRRSMRRRSSSGCSRRHCSSPRSGRLRSAAGPHARVRRRRRSPRPPRPHRRLGSDSSTRCCQPTVSNRGRPTWRRSSRSSRHASRRPASSAPRSRPTAGPDHRDAAGSHGCDADPEADRPDRPHRLRAARRRPRSPRPDHRLRAVPAAVRRRPGRIGDGRRRPERPTRDRLRPEAGGTRLFADYTAKNIGSYFAITVDGVVVSAPVIQSEIKSGEVQITGRGLEDSTPRRRRRSSRTSSTARSHSRSRRSGRSRSGPSPS